MQTAGEYLLAYIECALYPPSFTKVDGGWPSAALVSCLPPRPRLPILVVRLTACGSFLQLNLSGGEGTLEICTLGVCIYCPIQTS